MLVNQDFTFTLDSRVQPKFNTKIYNQIKMWELYGDYMMLQIEIMEMI
ncbi:hypothetical protein M5X02_32295 [Paenibacillus alvei]|nr:hypothetical protein [Paenibacillus alvei]EJW13961.1 hypothetical protein PAV_141p00670 [Paenibacillus alvei DSM 29]MCY9545310.1 hypothetical protein [Paenibacillus alvei]MCY9707676.1 hypothetical protein [Paenibacillus alvei]MEC0082811.1 hypothetical protein [Paenibacillus alvei]